jgi:hypothetical protein
MVDLPAPPFSLPTTITLATSRSPTQNFGPRERGAIWAVNES